MKMATMIGRMMIPMPKTMTIKGRLDCDPHHLYVVRDADNREVELDDWIEANFKDGSVVEIVVSEV